MYNSNLSMYFPQEYKPSKQQISILDRIGDALSKHKFVICCAPTGSGKSLLARTIAEPTNTPTKAFQELITTYSAFKQDYTGKYLNEDKCLYEPPFGAFVLTITKSLQDQYLHLFKDAKLLKGKLNYTCEVDNNYTTAFAPCNFIPGLKEKCCASNKCPYYNARNNALISKFSILNYSAFFSLPDHIKKKDIIICDEASEIEDEIIKQYSAEIVYDKLERYHINHTKLITDNKQKSRIWLYNLLEEIDKATKKLSKIFSKKHETISKPEHTKYLYLIALQRSLLVILSNWLKCEYVIDISAKQALFTPLRVGSLSSNIFKHSEKVVLMSATIISHKDFAKSLGITDYVYIEAESEFDPKNSPIYVSSACKLNHKTLKGSLPTICNQITDIINHHKNEKGVIHTHTQHITDYIQNKIGDNKRLLFRDTLSNNEKILKDHKDTTEPTILVSPSLAYGIDLKDELARFQIIVKLPFYPLCSNRIKKLFEEDKDWYENKMLNKLVQASGRATRSKNDFSITYILDGTFLSIIKRAKNKLPKYFIDRIH